MNDIKTALKKCTAIINTIPSKYINPFWLLHGLLSESLGNNKDFKEDFNKAIKLNESYKTYLEMNKSIDINIFPMMNRLRLK